MGRTHAYYSVSITVSPALVIVIPERAEMISNLVISEAKKKKVVFSASASPPCCAYILVLGVLPAV
jgi:hypothetical protein